MSKPAIPLDLHMQPSAHSAHSLGMPHSLHTPGGGSRGPGSGKGGSGKGRSGKGNPGKGGSGRGGSGKGKGRSGGKGGKAGWEFVEHARDGAAEHTADDAQEDAFDVGEVVMPLSVRISLRIFRFLNGTILKRDQFTSTSKTSLDLSLDMSMRPVA